MLQRLGCERWLDFRWCEILCSGQPNGVPSGWDIDSLWLGEAGPPDQEWLAGLAPGRAREFAERWEAGRRCYAAGLSQAGEFRCVGYLWVAVGPTRLPGQGSYVWDLPAGCAWYFDAYFHPLILGTYPDLARYVAQRLREEGIPRLLGQVEYDNRVSRRVHRMLGGERLGWIATVRVMGIAVHLDRHGEHGWRVRWGRMPARLAGFLPPAMAGEPTPAAQQEAV